MSSRVRNGPKTVGFHFGEQFQEESTRKHDPTPATQTITTIEHVYLNGLFTRVRDVHCTALHVQKVSYPLGRISFMFG